MEHWFSHEFCDSFQLMVHDLAYYVKGQRLLGGYKQRNGIVCSCCDNGDEGVEFPLWLLETSDNAVNFAPRFFLFYLQLCMNC